MFARTLLLSWVLERVAKCETLGNARGPTAEATGAWLKANPGYVRTVTGNCTAVVGPTSSR